MALTYPLTFPLPCHVRSIVMDIDRVQAVSQTRGGLIQAAERGRSLWTFQATTRALKGDDYETLRAFVTALRGRQKFFAFYDPLRKRPRAYPGSGWSGVVRADASPFDGTASVTAASGYLVSLSTLPAGWQVKAGDMLSWVWGSTRTLHRAVEDATANGSGVITNLTVEPDVPSGGGSYPKTVKLEAPDAVWMLTDPMPEFRRELNLGAPVTIAGLQILAA